MREQLQKKIQIIDPTLVEFWVLALKKKTRCNLRAITSEFINVRLILITNS